MNAPRILAALALCAFLAACGDRDAPGRTASGDGDTEALPSPEGSRGSVTGMPDKPGPGQVGPPQPAVAPLLDEQGNPILVPPEEAQPGDPSVGEAAPSPDAATPAEPGPQDAVAVLRDYYAAINRRDFARAHAMWGDDGRASGQTPQQFADGFADTTGVSVEILAPGEVDAGAGQRHIEVPVALTATHADGRQQRFVGAYTLSRTVVDGATAEQRAWHIASADLREVAP
ncbi:hypothetical protein [Lysobacter sp.]|uniref:hypothetical protein n=1 Tax=Lysobacter sp. TaxID=72226 RepID=UPI002D2C3494|nr:hypothetical protein [Lysobacter sp.]HZX76797.1 hypothetical protein [Lysobacter sp.]